GYGFLDTGLMYRAVTLAALERKAPLTNTQALSTIAEQVRLRVERAGRTVAMHVMVGQDDVTTRLRQPEVDTYVSVVSAVPEVRTELVKRQRTFARGHDVVMVGRDITTVVLPDAELKVFLTAAPEERARRRHLELQQSGSAADFEVVLQETRRRDKMDSERPVSPLRPAAGAVIIQTDGVSVDEVVERIVGELKKRAVLA
ncbi:MAG: (d)CMP kinase, partial [SAR202 cluster bacterium]|nr:(d)CMP kinase [SAR202 cluster bacterium]